MSRFAPQAPPPPPLGTGFVLDSTTGLYDVDGVVPQLLSGPLLATDLATIVRDIGSAGAPNPVPYAAAMSALLTGSTTQAPTPAPTPTSSTIPADGTLSGLPSTIVAGQPLTAASYVATTGSTYYLVLWNVAAAAEEVSRFAPGTMPGGTLSLLIPQKVGAYTVRGFSALTGGTATYESAQINVTAAPGALPATPTQTADTGATSSGVTMTWSATAPSYRVLTRNGVGVAYGSLSDTTTTATSYTFNGQASSTLLRAVVIPQNANGSGTPTGQFISSTGAASTTPTAPAYTFAVVQDNFAASGFDFQFNLFEPNGTRITPATLPTSGWTVSLGWSKSTTVAPASGNLLYVAAPWNGYQAGFWDGNSNGGYPFPNAGAKTGDVYHPWAITSDGATFCFTSNPHAAP